MRTLLFTALAGLLLAVPARAAEWPLSSVSCLRHVKLMHHLRCDLTKRAHLGVY